MRALAAALLLVAATARAEDRDDDDAPVVSPDGRTRYVSAAGGIDAIDVATGAAHRVYASPRERVDWCASIGKPSTPEREYPADHLVRLADGGRTLVIQRYGPTCHVPDSYELRVTDFADPVIAREHVAHPITSVAADARGTLWITDPDGLWRSTERGDRFTAVAIRVAARDDWFEGAPVQILVDRRRPRRLIARVAVGYGIGDEGAYLAASRDGGAHWRMLDVPSDAGPDDDAPRIRWVAAPDGDLDHLIAASDLGRDDDGRPRVDVRASRDGGRTWTRTGATDTPAPRTITIGGDVFEATDDGLYRTHAGARRLVTSTRTRPMPADLRW